jgi:hypothetical protein
VIVTMAENNLACFANTASDDDSMEGGEHTEKREWTKETKREGGTKEKAGPRRPLSCIHRWGLLPLPVDAQGRPEKQT